jgi:hypothetical protein
VIPFFYGKGMLTLYQTLFLSLCLGPSRNQQLRPGRVHKEQKSAKIRYVQKEKVLDDMYSVYWVSAFINPVMLI